jgi:hypothetical protein
MPTRDLMPVEYIDRKPKARPDMRTGCLLPGRLDQFIRRFEWVIEFKAADF